jgi:hypothetical protein
MLVSKLVVVGDHFDESMTNELIEDELVVA